MVARSASNDSSSGRSASSSTTVRTRLNAARVAAVGQQICEAAEASPRRRAAAVKNTSDCCCASPCRRRRVTQARCSPGAQTQLTRSGNASLLQITNINLHLSMVVAGKQSECPDVALYVRNRWGCLDAVVCCVSVHPRIVGGDTQDLHVLSRREFPTMPTCR
jgi:hypothetical protein